MAEIFRSKPDQAVYKIAPGVSVYDALRLMAGKNIGTLLVVEEGGSSDSSLRTFGYVTPNGPRGLAIGDRGRGALLEQDMRDAEDR